MYDPLVSVIIPLYNTEKYIEKAISEDKLCLPTTLELELQTNPFLMYDDPVFKNELRMVKSTDLEIFSETRTKKDNF